MKIDLTESKIIEECVALQQLFGVPTISVVKPDEDYHHAFFYTDKVPSKLFKTTLKLLLWSRLYFRKYEVDVIFPSLFGTNDSIKESTHWTGFLLQIIKR